MENTSYKKTLTRIIEWFKGLFDIGFEKEVEEANRTAKKEIKISTKSAGKILPEIEDDKPVKYIKGRFSKEEIAILEESIKDKTFKEVDWKKLSQKMNRKKDALKTKVKLLRTK